MTKLTSGLLHAVLLGSLPLLPACDQRPSAPAAWAPSQPATDNVRMSGAELNQLYAGIPLGAKLATLANMESVSFSSLASQMNINADLPALNLDGTTWSATVNPAVLARLDARYGTFGELIRQAGASVTDLAGQTNVAGLFRTEMRQEHAAGGPALSLTLPQPCLPNAAIVPFICGGVGLIMGGMFVAAGETNIFKSSSKILDIETGQETTRTDELNSDDPAMRGKADATMRNRLVAGATMVAAGLCAFTGGIVGIDHQCQ